jgi:predicted ArsR family transcriptional regulator
MPVIVDVERVRREIHRELRGMEDEFETRMAEKVGIDKSTARTVVDFLEHSDEAGAEKLGNEREAAGRPREDALIARLEPKRTRARRRCRRARAVVKLRLTQKLAISETPE